MPGLRRGSIAQISQTIFHSAHLIRYSVGSAGASASLNGSAWINRSPAPSGANRLKEGPLYAFGVIKEFFETEANFNLEIALEMEAAAQARCMQRPGLHGRVQCFHSKASATIQPLIR